MDVDWTTVLLAFIAAMPATLAALGAIVLGFHQRKQISTKVTEVAEKIETVHVSINSRMEELLESTKKAAGLEATQVERERGDDEAEAVAAAAVLAKPTEPMPVTIVAKDPVPVAVIKTTVKKEEGD